MKEINIAIYSTEMQKQVSQGIDLFRQEEGLRENAIVRAQFFEKREDLLFSMRKQSFQITIVAEDGARGFEAALGVRNYKSRIPLIWITGDEVFGVQSYRMHVQDFLVAPVQPEQVRIALKRCLEYMEGMGYEKRYS